MKKKLFLRLCLLTIALLSSQSCRQDLLPEKETYNNSSAFQLTSKRISLSQSKHKAKLLPELEKAEAGFKKLKTDALGKTVSYGNGVSIDTDNVTYIENGSDYHTYTFTVTRENATADAPLENLVLSPLTDGTYRELLFTYNLSATEKENIANGIPVDTQGKVSVTELAKGTYNNGGQLAKTSCNWVTTTVWVPCSENLHDASNFHECRFIAHPGEGTPPRAYTIEEYKCLLESDPGPGDGSGGSGSSGGGVGGGEGGTDPNDDPCNGNGVLTEPQQPGITHPNGCTGIPTMPNLPLLNTPCKKIKAQREEDGFTKRIDTLQGKTGLIKETGYIQKWGGSYEYKDNAGATATANTLSLPEVVSNTWIKAYMHTHVDDVPDSDKKGIKMFSPADASYLMDLVQNAQTNGHSLSDPYGVMVTSTGNYQIRFTGNKFQIKTFTKVERDYHNDPYGEAMRKFMDTSKKLELGFLKYIQEKMLLYGITLYRMNTDGTTTEIKLNGDKTDTVENTCP